VPDQGAVARASLHKGSKVPTVDLRTGVRRINSLCLGLLCPLRGEDCGVRAVQEESSPRDL